MLRPTFTVPTRARLVPQEDVDRLAARQQAVREEYRPETGWIDELPDDDPQEPSRK